MRMYMRTTHQLPLPTPPRIGVSARMGDGTDPDSTRSMLVLEVSHV